MLLRISVALALIIVAVLSRGVKCRGPVLAVLGSGGHTGEMLSILSRLNLRKPLAVVAGGNDTLSLNRARQLRMRQPEDSGSNTAPAGIETFYTLPRARGVGQSYITSIFTTLRTLVCACRLVWQLKPQIILCNGPANGAIVALAAKLLFLKTRVIYIESFARVNTLSLSGKLVYYLELSDRFLVQWPDLQRYTGVEYIGALV